MSFDGLKQLKSTCTSSYCSCELILCYDSMNHVADGAVNINRLPVSELTVASLTSKKKSSKWWHFFGKLIHTKDGKRKHIASDKVFCGPCLKKAQEPPKPATASNQLREEDVDVDDLPLPVVHDLFGG